MSAAIGPAMKVVFFQGIGSTFHQINRTVGILFSPESIIWPLKDLDEVIPLSWAAIGLQRWWMIPWYLFQMLFSIITLRPGAPYALDITKINIGHRDDVNALISDRESLLKPSDDYIAFGISRGALTTFVRYAYPSNAATADWNITDFGPKKMPKFVLLEGCPSSIPNAIIHRYSIFGTTFLVTAAEFLLRHFTRYDVDQAYSSSPLALHMHWPKDLPVAFVTSERDDVVPSAHTIMLASLLKERECQVHLLVLKDAHHTNYLTASKRDRQAYVSFVKDLEARYCSK
jgi:hypothetical protein